MWLATVGILLVGVAVAVWAASPTERKRRGIMEVLELGDSTARVVEMLGAPPARCPGASLAHLQEAFPPGWPVASAETAVQTLQERTRERWVYPVSARRRAGCQPADGQTEIGVDPQGRILWYVTVTGKTPLRLPAEITPARPAGSATGTG